MWKAVAIGCALLAPAAARADVILTLVNSGGGTSATVGEGDPFPINVKLTVTDNDQVLGVGFWLEEATSAGFTTVSRTPQSAHFTDRITADALVASALDAVAPNGVPDNALKPRNGYDLGLLVPIPGGGGGPTPFTVNTVTATGTGVDLLMSLTLGTGSVPVGIYTITISASPAGVSLEWVDQDFVPNDFASLGSYTVEVVPEPGSFALLALGLAVLAQTRASRRIAARRQPPTPATSA